MILIEFKLHNGKVPYFVKDYLSYKIEGKDTTTGKKNRYIGITRKDENNDEYLPKTVVQLNQIDCKVLIKTAKITKQVDMEKNEELNDTEKETILNKFIKEVGFKETPIYPIK